MFGIAEKLGFIKVRAVKVYTKAGTGIIAERKNTCFLLILEKTALEEKKLKIQGDFCRIAELERRKIFFVSV